MKDLEFKSYIQDNYLANLGQKILLQRKRLKVSADSTALASGISRITLHRIEKGEPSVSMGAYISVIEALGLHLDLSRKNLQRHSKTENDLNLSQIAIKDYPQLQQICWQLSDDAVLTAVEAKNTYERNERHINFDGLSDKEKNLIKQLEVYFKNRIGNAYDL
jgi:transcriptional regulator with XRE-family HTH domain